MKKRLLLMILTALLVNQNIYGMWSWLSSGAQTLSSDKGYSSDESDVPSIVNLKPHKTSASNDNNSNTPNNKTQKPFPLKNITPLHTVLYQSTSENIEYKEEQLIESIDLKDNNHNQTSISEDKNVSPVSSNVQDIKLSEETLHSDNKKPIEKKSIKNRIKDIRWMIDLYEKKEGINLDLLLKQVETVEKMYPEKKDNHTKNEAVENMAGFIDQVFLNNELYPEIERQLFNDEINAKKLNAHIERLIYEGYYENKIIPNIKHLNFIARAFAQEINTLLELKQKQLKENTYTDKPIPHKRKIKTLKGLQQRYSTIKQKPELSELSLLKKQIKKLQLQEKQQN